MTDSTITLNGEAHPLGEPAPLPDLLESLGLASKPVVVELDGRALPRSAHPGTVIHPGARLVIVTLAAGG
ncbi:MAG: sulfur carrier protein ThiS [Akkermansiaceae bacterium]|nr:sulfur carrier protein ThiS [Akkermansiaceae bacterium]NNM30300.1 sulfur carrier protein ThiS [Akkermansiaceae bacterium]